VLAPLTTRWATSKLSCSGATAKADLVFHHERQRK